MVSYNGHIIVYILRQRFAYQILTLSLMELPRPVLFVSVRPCVKFKKSMIMVIFLRTESARTVSGWTASTAAGRPTTLSIATQTAGPG